MKALLIIGFLGVSLVVPGSATSEYDEFWQNFKAHHKKQYSEAEEKMSGEAPNNDRKVSYRECSVPTLTRSGFKKHTWSGSRSEFSGREITWEKNLRYIINHNLEADRGQYTFRLGMNEYGDLSNKEYVQYLAGVSTYGNLTSDFLRSVVSGSEDLPSRVDWREKGYVTPVKDQKTCLSGWAFSTTGSIEGQLFRQTGKLVSLSEQNLVDCSRKFGNAGCHKKGGSTIKAFNYIMENGGIDTEDSYPYFGNDTDCKFDPKNVGAKISGTNRVIKDNETNLQEAVASVGPISVEIDATSDTFRFYKSGVYKDSKCSSGPILGHGVLAVGYGVDGNEQYWLVKNSWGTTWGEQGYIRMARNRSNMCGIATRASYPAM